jgi:hypothetical protein
MKMTKEDLKKYIKEEAEKMFKSEGDPMDVDMNSMVKDEKLSSVSLVAAKQGGGFEKKTATKVAGDPMEVKLNTMDKEEGKGAVASVEATSSTLKGDSLEGMHKAKKEIKTGNPETSSSEPFDEKVGKIDMESNDKNIDDAGAKTFVEPGAKVGSGAGTGKAAPKFSEEAKNEKEKMEKIAKGIQLPEVFKSKKELTDFIMNEARKVSKLL